MIRMWFLEERGKPMGGLTRRDPFRWIPSNELEEIGERCKRVFGRLPSRGETGQESATIADWAPTVDITEDDKEHIIEAAWRCQAPSHMITSAVPPNSAGRERVMWQDDWIRCRWKCWMRPWLKC